MNLLISIFNTILYQPLFNGLVFLYIFLPGHDFGIAVIVLTVLIKLIFYPLGSQAFRSQKALSVLQPKITEVQRKHKDDKEKQVRATMELYQKEKINPLGGFLPLLIQFPILIALYQVFWKGLRPEEMANLYSFVSQPKIIDPIFFGLINLAKSSLILALIAAIFQFFQTKMLTIYQPVGLVKTPEKTDQITSFSNLFQKQMLYFFPIFTVFILWKLPAAIAIYWITTSLFSLVQQYFFFKPRSEKT